MSDRQAAAIAAAHAETDALAPEVAKRRGIGLAGIFQIIIAEAGRRTREGQSQNQVADELRPAIETVLDDLDAWNITAPPLGATAPIYADRLPAFRQRAAPALVAHRPDALGALGSAFS